MSEISVSKMPENVSYSDIHKLLDEAHKINYDRGIIFPTMRYTVKELEDRVYTNKGVTFIAKDGDRIVGTASCYPSKICKWYHQGPLMKWLLVGVLPEYRGRRITSLLLKAVEEETERLGLEVIFFDTAEKNVQMIKSSKRNGFLPVKFFAPNSNHYSVTMMKWLHGCPYPTRVVKFKYLKSVAKTKFLYKPGGEARFGANRKNPNRGK